jgi:hypothetical protein
VSDEAKSHPFISEEEKTFIIENHAKQEKKRDDSKVNKNYLKNIIFDNTLTLEERCIIPHFGLILCFAIF